MTNTTSSSNSAGLLASLLAGVTVGVPVGVPVFVAVLLWVTAIIFEVDGVTEEIAKEALYKASAKLPIKTKFIKR